MSTPHTDDRATFLATRRRLRHEFYQHQNPHTYLTAHSDALDRWLCALAQKMRLPATRLAFIAVGGYGRRELFPYSDIDLLILVARDVRSQASVRAQLEAFTTELWNSPLKAGVAVRTPESFLEEARHDISIATTYLEARFLWGDENFYHENITQFFQDLDPADFYQKKTLELARRHQRFEDTPYSLEPNIKESPGGLRDLHVFSWCTLATQAKADASCVALTPQEKQAIEHVRTFLSQIRIHLHFLRRRDENRLIFDVQEALAQQLGFSANESMRASEVFMKAYYRNAQRVVQLSTIQMQLLEESLYGPSAATPVQIDEDFWARGHELDITHDHVFHDHPHAILRTFLHFAKHQELSRLSSRLLRALWHETFHIREDFPTDPINRETFFSIITLPIGPYHALKAMNLWGILGRFIPPFQDIVGQMQHDLYHIFTVDQHTLRVVRNIRRFARSDFAHEYPFCTQVMNGLQKPWRLVLAALFHDIGKGQGGHHEVVGAERFDQWARMIGMDANDRRFIYFLIRQHLTMSLTAQKSDISDPNVIKKFAQVVATKEQLDALYLLTVADIRATSPKVWNPWKAQLIETLYRLTQPILDPSAQGYSIESQIEARKNQARQTLTKWIDEASLQQFWSRLDVSYFLRHRAEDLIWHGTIATAARTPTIKTRLTASQGLEILVYTPDQKALFSSIIGFISARGLSIADARIHTTRDHWALDTFIVFDPFDSERLPQHAEAIQAQLLAHLKTSSPLKWTSQHRPSRRSQHFPIRPSVTIVPSDQHSTWLLSVVGQDRVGLLYDLSHTLGRYGINLLTAKIATLGERVEDVFLIEGEILEHETQVLDLENELLRLLQQSND